MTRRMSQRARAQEIFREMTEGQGANASAPAAQDLTARVRALYENSAVPVREIAAVAGVSERTLYKYARNGGWKAGYAWIDPGGIKGRRLGRRWRAADAVAPGKGAGGRFIRREDKGKPFARGLKATDPAGAVRADAACVRAAAIAAQAQAEALWAQWNATFIDLLKFAAMLRDQLADYRALRAKRRPQRDAAAADRYEQWLEKTGHTAVDCLELCQAHMHEAMLRAIPALAAARR